MINAIANALSDFVRQHPTVAVAYIVYNGTRSVMRTLPGVEDGLARIASSPHRIRVLTKKHREQADSLVVDD